MESFLDIALREAQEGRRVFPCHGKTPAVAGGRGVLDATTSERQIVEWSAHYMDCNVGVGFFEDSEEIGVDIDLNNLPKWREYEAQYGQIETRIVQTGSGGYHLYFKRPQGKAFPNIPQAAGKGFELKSNGAYLIAPGSVHPDTKKEYKVIKALPPAEMPEWLVNICLNGHPPAATAGPSPAKIPNGQHDRFLFSQAASYRRRGDSVETIIAKLHIDLDRLENTNPADPFTDKDLERIAKSAAKYQPEEAPPLSEEALSPPNNPRDNEDSVYNSLLEDTAVSKRDGSVTTNVTKHGTKQAAPVTPLVDRIHEWIAGTHGWFSYDDLDRELNIRAGNEKDNRRKIVQRFKESGVIEFHPNENKKLRYVNNAAAPILFKNAYGRQPMDIQFPFGIENYFNCYPKNIIVVAGAPDAGKTAWLLNLIRMNQNRHLIHYFSSEMGDTELATRLEQFHGLDLDDWSFQAKERSSHFADIISPDDINIIDYMELTSEVYLVAEYLREIHDKLKNGIAIVALQKKRGADLGRGGEFSLEKPRLYLSMDAGVMKIQKAKNWATSENPNRKVINFKIVRGCEFIVTNPWHDEEG